MGVWARAWAHKLAQPSAGRWQLRRSAGHSSVARSLPQPGRSPQAAGSQRERGRSTVPSGHTGGVGAVRGLAGLAGLRCSIGAGAWRGSKLQAFSPARRASQASGRRARDNEALARPASEARSWARNKVQVMWLLILEAVAAAGLLGLIVWWTMFSGRNAGERREEDATPEDRRDDKAD